MPLTQADREYLEDLVADTVVAKRRAIAAGSISSTELADDSVTAAKIAPISFNAQTGTTYTPALSDIGKVVTLSNAGAILVTLPQDSVVAFPIGDSVSFAWLGDGQPTFEAGSGATVNSAGGLLAIAVKYNVVTALKRAANTWILIGALA
jgi:hypothetical protein